MKLIIIPLFLILMLLAVMQSCQKGTITPTMKFAPYSNHQSENTPPLLKQLPIDLAPYNSITMKAGALNFLKANQKRHHKIFLEHGAVVKDPKGNSKILIGYDFKVPEGTPIYAPLDGEISRLEFQEDSDDFEISINHLYPERNNSKYDVILDHFTKLDTLTLGSVVKAGELLGYARERIELQINGPGNNQSLCPLEVFETETKSKEIESLLKNIMIAWESYTGREGIYQIEKHYRAGCHEKIYNHN